MSRPRRPPAKESAEQTALQDRIAAAGLAGAQSGTEGDAENAAANGAVVDIHQGVMDQFDEVFNASSGLSDEDLALLREQFQQAAREAEQSSSAAAVLPERTEWVGVVDALREMGAVEEDESNELIRKLDDALQPLQQRKVKIAMEFSRRLQEHGEAEALEWFRAQDADVPAEGDAPVTHSRDQVVSGDSTVKSRSRRLRGPPR